MALIEIDQLPKAFSSKVGTGLREKNAQEINFWS